MPNHPGLHEGVPRASRGYELQADPLPVFALRGRTVFGTGNPWHNRPNDMNCLADTDHSAA
jgi:hypothetical protein